MKNLLYGFSLLSVVFSVQASPWNYEVAPYLWATSIAGTQQTGPYRFHVSESFTELLKHLDFGAMLYISAYRNNFGVFFNGIYSKVSDDINSLRDLHIHMASAMTIDTAGISYRIHPNTSWVLEPYLGARYTLNSTKLDINNLNIKQKYNWTDAVVGSRLIYTFNRAWNIEGSADYGRGTNSYSYNLSALLGYQSPTHFKNTRFYLGYRYLHQNYDHGDQRAYYLWDMNLFGPIAGFVYRFG